MQKKVFSLKYEIGKQIILGLLQKGLISQAEFEAIDKENLKTFTNE